MALRPNLLVTVNRNTLYVCEQNPHPLLAKNAKTACPWRSLHTNICLLLPVCAWLSCCTRTEPWEYNQLKSADPYILGWCWACITNIAYRSGARSHDGPSNNNLHPSPVWSLSAPPSFLDRVCFARREIASWFGWFVTPLRSYSDYGDQFIYLLHLHLHSARRRRGVS